MTGRRRCATDRSRPRHPPAPAGRRAPAGRAAAGAARARRRARRCRRARRSRSPSTRRPAEADLDAVRRASRPAPTARTSSAPARSSSAAQLDAARRSGADFAVAPVLDVDLVAMAVDIGVPFIPGALTPDRDRRRLVGRRDVRQAVPGVGRGPAVRARGSRAAARDPDDPDRRRRRRERRARSSRPARSAVGVGGAILRADAAGRRAIVAACRGAGVPGDDGGAREAGSRAGTSW